MITDSFDIATETYINEEDFYGKQGNEYSTPPEPLCPVLRATHSVERAIFLFR